MLRSALAVVSGIAVLTATSFAIEGMTNPLLVRMFPQALPNRAAISFNLPASLFMFAYTALCVVAGGYTTAWIARGSPARHAAIMGVIQTILTVFAMKSFPDQAPLRNWIVGMVVTLPAAWSGGLLRAARIRKSDPGQAEPA